MDKNMNKVVATIGAVFVFVMLAFCSGIQQAQATTIDTTGTKVGDIWPFGYLNTATYGQTFSVSGPDTVLNDFSLYLENRLSGSGTLDLRGYIAGWDGNKASSILYESATQTMNSEGNLQQFLFNTGGLNLVAGNQYVAFLSISNLGFQPNSTFNMPESSDMIPGQFVYINNGTDFGALTTQYWSQGYAGQNDVWFKADFKPSQVPEPSTIFLLGAGLTGFGLLRKRFKS